jgi:hypothetical protein
MRHGVPRRDGERSLGRQHFSIETETIGNRTGASSADHRSPAAERVRIKMAEQGDNGVCRAFPRVAAQPVGELVPDCVDADG